MRKMFAVIATALTFALAGVASGANPIQYNVDPGGGQITSFFYTARVYIYYDGYWHWLNCQYVVYTDGSVDLVRCW